MSCSAKVPCFLGYRSPSGNPPILTCLDAQVNKTVQVLNLRDNEIGDKGTTALADALKVNFCLVPRMFFLSLVTALGNPSSLVVLFVQVNSTVTDLNLRFNKFGDAGTIALSEALKVSFVFFRERSSFSGLPPSPLTHLF